MRWIDESQLASKGPALASSSSSATNYLSEAFQSLVNPDRTQTNSKHHAFSLLQERSLQSVHSLRYRLKKLAAQISASVETTANAVTNASVHQRRVTQRQAKEVATARRLEAPRNVNAVMTANVNERA
ncbi:hypothetical protein B566_EDAN003138 [Ephemera danica]|nr:hypothetical protein B566_EDAN003138 [Ephemera danica]